MKVSLCIATMNRWDNFLSKYLPKYLENPYIGEIVISDENGNDASKIRETFTDPRIKLYVNAERLGAFRNKRNAVSKASLPWICLMDSDNFAPIEYFEAWLRVFDSTDTTMIYSPSYTYPTDNHPGFNWRHMLGDVFTPFTFREVAAKHWHNNQLNVGNYIVHKELFMKGEPIHNSDLQVRCHALDVQYQNYLLFIRGASMKLVDGMNYYHLVHNESYFITEGAKAAKDEIYNLYKNVLKVYFDGFWSGFHERTNATHDLFFLDLMKAVYGKDVEIATNKDEADILIENTQINNSNKNYKKWRHTYLFSGESYIRSDRNEYSCVLYGQRNHKNIINCPEFVPYVHCSLGKQFQENNRFSYVKEVPKKDVLVVVSNPGGHIRNKFIEKLEQSGLNITFAGAYKNNIGGAYQPYYNSNEFNEYVKQFKFMLAMENSEEDTYITEKVIHGLRAGVVPIYWGSKRVHDYNNKDRILTVETERDIDTIISKMKTMSNSHWLNMVNQPGFTEFGKQYSVNTIAKHIQNLLMPGNGFEGLSTIVTLCNQSFEPQRFEQINKFFDKFKVPGHMRMFISPTYKHTISDIEAVRHVRHDYMMDIYNRPMKKSELSIILNFKAVFEYLEKTYLDGMFLVLESDAHPYDTFADFKICLNKLKGKQWSAVNLGRDEGYLYKLPYCDHDGPYRKGWQVDSSKIYTNAIEDISTSEDKDIRFVRKFNPRCCDAQLFSYAGVKQILSFLNTIDNYGAPFDYIVMKLLEENMDFKYYWSSISYFQQGSNFGLDTTTNN
jgi:hypothetical protein